MTSALPSGVGVKGEKEDEPTAATEVVDVMRGEGRWKETSSGAATEEEEGTLADGKARAGDRGPAAEPPSRVLGDSTCMVPLLLPADVTEEALTTLAECMLGVTSSLAGGIVAESANLAILRDEAAAISVGEHEPAALPAASTDEFRRFHTVELLLLPIVLPAGLLKTACPTLVDRVEEDPMPPTAGTDTSEPLAC